MSIPPDPPLLTTTTNKLIFEKKLSNHIRPVHNNDSVSVCPNPVYDNGFSVEFGLQSLSKVSVSILDLSGSLVSQPLSNHSFTPGAHKLNIPLVNIRHGTYFMQITFDGIKQTHKIIVM